ncbi:hypothetical protein DICVIV_05813 [Dictyocaulus viviparus]|uniref:SKA complex subunit 1 n=1 Tax=Dictyocaulus viviparus TaxID=29172 RepID=A0A0D8XWB4_DICVI|nr:hypothetical protein DICVIV_05813 [Dictyocaulus viviparus]
MANQILIGLGEEHLDPIISRKNDIVEQIGSILPAKKIEEGTRCFQQKLEEIRQIFRDCALVTAELRQLAVMEQVYQNIGDVTRSLEIPVNYVRGSSPDIVTSLPSKNVPLIHNEECFTGCALQTFSPTQEVTKPSGSGIIELVTPEEFDSIPKYMRGRISHAEMNEIIVKFNEFFAFKRKLLSTALKKLSKEEKELVYKWKERDTPITTGKLFCQEIDIKPNLKSRTRAVFQKVVPCLRHIRRIKELRDKGQVFYLPYHQ